MVPRPREGEGDAIRAFFAVEIGAAAREAAAAAARTLRAAPGGGEVRWVRAENLHVTLRFLGDVAPGAIPGLVDSVAEHAAGVSGFQLALGEARPFPSARRPRVVIVEVAPEAPLAALAAAVERGVVAAGFAPEERGFRPHLTLGRIKSARRMRFPDVTAPVTAAGDPFDVTEAVLFRSELRPSGAQYTALERIPLAGAPASAETVHPRITP